MHHPKLVVFDCDATLWSPECFQLDARPRIQPIASGENGTCQVVRWSGSTSNSNNNGSNGQTVRLFPDVHDVFAHIQATMPHTRIALASTTRYPDVSRQLREAFLVGTPPRSIAQVCQPLIQVFYAEDKVQHFVRLQQDSRVEFADMLFFDDCIWGDNVGQVCAALGVCGLRVPRGLTMDLFQQGLELWRRQQPQRHQPSAG
jgi:magnesium-dependent phosphatase 1